MRVVASLTVKEVIGARPRPHTVGSRDTERQGPTKYKGGEGRGGEDTIWGGGLGLEVRGGEDTARFPLRGSGGGREGGEKLELAITTDLVDEHVVKTPAHVEGIGSAPPIRGGGISALDPGQPGGRHAGVAVRAGGRAGGRGFGGEVVLEIGPQVTEVSESRKIGELGRSKRSS